MSDALTVDTAPASRLGASLADAAQALTDPGAVLVDVAARIRADAAARTPRATGALAGSATTGRETIDGLPAVTLSWGVRYALFVNYGTVHMRARPFATDAVAAGAAAAEPLLAAWADTILGKVDA